MDLMKKIFAYLLLAISVVGQTTFNNVAVKTNLTISGAQVSTKVDSVAALKALVVTQDKMLISTLGYYSAGDGGGADYYFDASSSSSPDNGSVIQPNSGSGRFILIRPAVVNVLQFGAKRDFALLSWTGTDNTATFQAAINYARSVSTAGTPSIFVPAGTYGINSLSAHNVSIIGVDNGTDTTYRPSILAHVSGATGDMLDVDEVSGGAYLQKQRFATIENILFIGSRERNLKNPKTITASSSRTSFSVATNDLPTQPSDYTAWPYYGVAMIFTSENRFAGHAVIQSINYTTGQLTVATGYDNYATLSGASGLLTPGWKICFPTVGTLGESSTNRLDNTSGGYAAIKCIGSGFRRIKNCNFINLHCGIRLGSSLVVETQNLWAYGLSLSLVAQAWLDQGADDSHIRYYNQGAYFVDYGLSPESLTLTDTEYRRCAFGMFGVRSRAQISQLTADGCVTGLIQYSGYQQNFVQTLLDYPVKTAILSINGSSRSTGLQFGDVQVTAQRYTIPTYITYPSGSRDAIVTLGGSWTNSVVISSLSCILWPGQPTNQNWANLVYSTGISDVRISQLIPGTGYNAISSSGNYPLIGSVSGGVLSASDARWGVVKTSDTTTALVSGGSEGVRVNTASVGAAPTVGIRNPSTLIGHVDQLGFNFSFGSDGNNNAARTDSVSKTARFSFVPYTVSQNNITLVHGNADGTANVFNYGGAVGDQQAITDHRFYAAPSVNTLSGTFVARINTGGMVLGPSGISGNIDASLLFEPRSTTKGMLAGPKMTTVQSDAISSPVSGLQVFDTTANKVRTHDGTRFRYGEMYLPGSVTWDIPSTASGGEQNTTVSITGAAVGDIVLVTPSRISPSFTVCGVVQSSGVVTLYAINASTGTIDPVSQTYTIHVLKP